MIEIFEGRIGGGKTYSAVSRMIAHLKDGGTICTNVRLKWDGIAQLIRERYDGLLVEEDQLIQLTNEQITLFHKHVPWGDLRGGGDSRVLVVVDEAHLYFNARDWASANRETLAFLTQSDKVSVDIIFISQSITNIDKQFRVLMLFVWRFKDLEKWKIPGLGIGYTNCVQLLSMGASEGKHILAVQMDYDGKTCLQREFVNKDPAIFNCYETAALLTDFEVAQPKAKKRKLKKQEKEKVPMYKFALPVVIIGGVCALMMYGKKSNASETAEKPASAAPMAAPSPFAQGEKRTKEDKPLTRYDIYEEEFRGYYGGERVLSTGSGWYQLGEMSSRGIVTAVSDRRARVEQPDGRVGYIVATARGLGVTTATGVAKLVTAEPPKKTGEIVKPAQVVKAEAPVVDSKTTAKPKMTRAERIRGGYKAEDVEETNS